MNGWGSEVQITVVAGTPSHLPWDKMAPPVPLRRPMAGSLRDAPLKPAQSPGERLDSWKEIASYLKRDIRTVQRWEKKEGLPVHRHLHEKLGAVFAYRSEIDSWWVERSPDPPAQAESGKVRLALLPFENLSGNPDEEYFADGLTEEMISQLGWLHPQRMSVIARASALSYKHATKDIRQIARELAADYLLRGSVRREGGRVRITASLIEARGQSQLWVNTYERALQAILDLQSDVARAVAREVGLRLAVEQKARLGKSKVVNTEAYEHCLRGRFHLNQRTDDGLKLAAGYFRRAIAADPDSAAGHAGLADALMIPASFAYDDVAPHEAMPQAKAAVVRALELDGSLAEAHTTLAEIQLTYDWDFAAAESSFRKAQALNPGYSIAYYWYSRLLIQLGRKEEAFAAIRSALELDPLSLPINMGLAWLQYLAGDYEATIRQCRNLLEIDPGFLPGRVVMVLSYEQTGRLEQALADLEAHPAPKAVLASDPMFCGVLARIHARAGRRADAARDLDKLRQLSRKRFVPAFYIAMAEAALGKVDQSLESLEECYRQRLESALYLGVEPGFQVLRSDPRFGDLLRRIGLPS